jgi:CTP:molybdopterin cytidylyltransferase MocA
MGFDKITTPLNDVSPLEIIVRMLGERRAVVVAPSSLAANVRKYAPSADYVTNDDAERGMSYSLKAGLRAVPVGSSIGVLLGDMPLMTATIICRTESLMDGSTDVAYPVDAMGRSGHPVLFAPWQRTFIERLPDGDTLRHARDSAARKATWLCTESAAFADVDVPLEWQVAKDALLNSPMASSSRPERIDQSK